jgi:hypothetical protein
MNSTTKVDQQQQIDIEATLAPDPASQAPAPDPSPQSDPRVDQALGVFSDLTQLEVSPTAMIAASHSDRYATVPPVDGELAGPPARIDRRHQSNLRRVR